MRAASFMIVAFSLLIIAGCANDNWRRQPHGANDSGGNARNNPAATGTQQPIQNTNTTNTAPPQPAQPAANTQQPARAAEFSRNADSRIANARHVKTLVVHCGEGSLKIEGSDRRSLDVNAWVYAFAESPSEATRVSREISVDLTSVETENPAIMVTGPHAAHSAQRWKVDLTIHVPKKVRVKIIDGAGDIEVTGLTHGVEIENKEGEILISDLQGGVELTNHGGNVEIVRTKGKIDVNDDNADLLISEADEVIVRDRGGKLTIQHIGGNVVARGNQQGIRLLNIGGKAEVFGFAAAKSEFDGIGKLILE